MTPSDARPDSAGTTIPGRLFDQAKTRPWATAYCTKVGGAWVPTTYARYASLVTRAAKALMALGCAPGSSVAILAGNRPEWAIADLACMAIGGAPAGIYITSSPSEVRYVVGHTEAQIVFVDSDAQWQKIRKERDNLPRLRWVVTMEGLVVDDPGAISWQAFLAKGDATTDAAFVARVRALEPKGLATLIYTSGTTGPPKGVMLSHENLVFAGTQAVSLAGVHAGDRTLSYLPLSHIAEQILTLFGPITAGSTVYFAESIEKVPENLREVRPSVFFGVPRIWEKLHAGIAPKLASAKGAKRALVAWARWVGRRAAGYTMRGAPLPWALDAQHRLANTLFYAKLKKAIGLDRGRLFASGAAPIALEVLEFFAALDIVICETYGQSEGTGSGSFNRPGQMKLGSVGRMTPGVEAKIAADGEILLRGPNVFLGYAKDAAATAEAVIDGWLSTGDLGAIDADGFVSITGRKKELIITAGGKNIAPTNIEAALKNHRLVGEAVVIGDRRKHLCALIVLDAEAASRFRAERGLGDAPRDGGDDPAVRAELQRALDAVNAEMARVEQVKKFVIVTRPFSVETGELTPTLKIKRKVVEQHFAAEIESMYRE